MLDDASQSNNEVQSSIQVTVSLEKSESTETTEKEEKKQEAQEDGEVPKAAISGESDTSREVKDASTVEDVPANSAGDTPVDGATQDRENGTPKVENALSKEALTGLEDLNTDSPSTEDHATTLGMEDHKTNKKEDSSSLEDQKSENKVPTTTLDQKSTTTSSQEDQKSSEGTTSSNKDPTTTLGLEDQKSEGTASSNKDPTTTLGLENQKSENNGSLAEYERADSFPVRTLSFDNDQRQLLKD